MKPNIKAIIFGAVLMALSFVPGDGAAQAKKTIGDAKDALEDDKITPEEAKTLAADCIATAKSFWPEGSAFLDALSVNVDTDIPNIETTFSELHKLTAAKAGG